MDWSLGVGVARLLFDVLSVTGPEPLPTTTSQWVNGHGSYIIHEEITEAQACHKAETRAKLNAIQEFNGEFISSDTVMSCKENGSDVECPAQTLTLSMLEGLIIGVRNKSVIAKTNLKEQRVCKVTLEAHVSTQTEKTDPNFDMSVNINPSTLRDGDKINISVEPTEQMYVYVFTEESKGTLVRMFPNPFDKENNISSRTTIPSTSGYSIRASLDPNLLGNDSQEVVHVLGSKNKLSLLNNYSREDFNLKLIEIPNNQKRYVRKSYRIVK